METKEGKVERTSDKRAVYACNKEAGCEKNYGFAYINLNLMRCCCRYIMATYTSCNFVTLTRKRLLMRKRMISGSHDNEGHR